MNLIEENIAYPTINENTRLVIEPESIVITKLNKMKQKIMVSAAIIIGTNQYAHAALLR